MKKRTLLPLVLLFISVEIAFSQIGINATNTPPATNAMLDISSTTKGLLIPRMTTDQRNLLTATEGLTVYDTDTKGYWFYNGTSWQNMSGSGGGSSKWLSTANDISNINSGNVGIGIATPLGYGHGGTNKIVEIKNNDTGSNAQSQIILSTAGTSGSMGGLTWAAPNMPGAEKRAGLIANLFQTANESRMAFFSRTEAGNLTEKLSIRGNGNVGIGTTAPGFPLNFSNSLGDKISLYGNSGAHYGFGIQGGLFQIHSDAAGANIAFGHGSSGSFTERMRIINNGTDGMILSGRLLIKNGSVPVDPNQTPGVWLYRADNTNLLGFMGTQNNQNVGFYGGPANGGWGFTYDAVNSRVGIGTSNPNAPLGFPPSLGKKITLYPGATGDAGFGMAGNRLQIYADNQAADVAIGYDAAGTFNERFAVKPSGALAVNGNTGALNNVLTSGGGGSPQWQPLSNFVKPAAMAEVTYVLSPFLVQIPGASFQITVPQTGKLVIWVNTNSSLICVNPLAPCPFIWILKTYLNNTDVETNYMQPQSNLSETNNSASLGPLVLNVNAGTYTISYGARLTSLAAPPTIKISAYAQFIAD